MDLLLLAKMNELLLLYWDCLSSQDKGNNNGYYICSKTSIQIYRRILPMTSIHPRLI